MCILGLCRVYVSACVSAGTTGTSAVNLCRYGNTPQTITIDVVLLDPGPHRHDRTARGFCVFRACRISKLA